MILGGDFRSSSGVTMQEVQEVMAKGNAPYRTAAKNEEYERGYDEARAKGDARVMEVCEANTRLKRVNTAAAVVLPFLLVGFMVSGYFVGHAKAKETVREVRVEVPAPAPAECKDQVVEVAEEGHVHTCPNPKQALTMTRLDREGPLMLCLCPREAASVKP